MSFSCVDAMSQSSSFVSVFFKAFAKENRQRTEKNKRRMSFLSFLEVINSVIKSIWKSSGRGEKNQSNRFSNEQKKIPTILHEFIPLFNKTSSINFADLQRKIVVVSFDSRQTSINIVIELQKLVFSSFSFFSSSSFLLKRLSSDIYVRL